MLVRVSISVARSCDRQKTYNPKRKKPYDPDDVAGEYGTARSETSRPTRPQTGGRDLEPISRQTSAVEGEQDGSSGSADGNEDEGGSVTGKSSPEEYDEDEFETHEDEGVNGEEVEEEQPARKKKKKKKVNGHVDTTSSCMIA